MTIDEQAVSLHRKYRGKIGTAVVVPITTKEELALSYTPGVAAVSQLIAKDKAAAYDLTIKSHTIAIVTDGSAVLGLGNIGPEAALPVMEGKAALFKTFANIDAFPICLDSQDSEEIIKAVKLLAPVFGGINLEDISAPRCFEIEDRLQNLGIPIMHDDQHGTAVVALAGLINASKVTQKDLASLTVVISGAGAAGSAIAKILEPLVNNIILVDSLGIISKARNDLHPYKRALAEFTNKGNLQGDLNAALKGADVFIGVSKPDVLKPEAITLMASRPIIFALANPTPEIMPEMAKQGGAYVVATGRSDFPNQINNSLAFPGIFLGALRCRASKISPAMKVAAAKAIAQTISDPTPDLIIPGPFTPNLAEIVATAVATNS